MHRYGPVVPCVVFVVPLMVTLVEATGNGQVFGAEPPTGNPVSSEIITAPPLNSADATFGVNHGPERMFMLPSAVRDPERPLIVMTEGPLDIAKLLLRRSRVSDWGNQHHSLVKSFLIARRGGWPPLLGPCVWQCADSSATK